MMMKTTATTIIFFITNLFTILINGPYYYSKKILLDDDYDDDDGDDFDKNNDDDDNDRDDNNSNNNKKKMNRKGNEVQRQVSTTTKTTTTRRRVYPRRKLIISIVTFRFLYWFVMSMSCLIIPTHNPGNDVQRFELRLLSSLSSSSIRKSSSFHKTDDGILTNDDDDDEKNDNNANFCFCLRRHSCPKKRTTTITGGSEQSNNEVPAKGIDNDNNNNNNQDDDICADSYSFDTFLVPPLLVKNDEYISISSSSFQYHYYYKISFMLSHYYWNFWLSPLTKWDAARFLNLAIQPNLRNPVPFPRTRISTTSTTSNTTCESNGINRNDDDDEDNKNIDGNYNINDDDNHDDDNDNDNDEKTCILSSSFSDDISFDASEQAHAFFPLFPTLIRIVAQRLLYVLQYLLSKMMTIMMTIYSPNSHILKLLLFTVYHFLIPPTFEGVIVLSGMIINLLCLIVGSLAMYDLTLSILSLPSSPSSVPVSVSSMKSKESQRRGEVSVAYHQRKSRQQHHKEVEVALSCALIYGIWNPAGIFFATTYSESLFSTCTLIGHALMIRATAAAAARTGKVPTEKSTTTTTTTTTDRNSRTSSSSSSRQKHILQRMIYGIFAIISWMLASYTRSNGTLQSLWLLYFAFAHCINLVTVLRRQSSTSSSRPFFGKFINTKKMICMKSMVIFLSLVSAIMVSLPVWYHDWQGYQRHCDYNEYNDDHHHLDIDDGADRQQLQSSPIRPVWCQTNTTTDANTTTDFISYIFSFFSLYQWIQHHHWNVGLLRYYQWKQVPNFLLATPIFLLSYVAISSWISWSINTFWIEQHNNNNNNNKTRTEEKQKKKPWWLQLLLIDWPIYALNESIYPTTGPTDDTTNTLLGLSSTRTSTSTSTSTPRTTLLLLYNPILLSHYAILAIVSLIGLLIAHVQISTRLIVSSCPAMIWFLSYCWSSEKEEREGTEGNQQDEDNSQKNHPFGNLTTLKRFVQVYTLLYLLLGVILHVNFLPWT